MVAPTLIDCWHVRDLARFRAILKGGPDRAAAHTLSGSGSIGAQLSKSPHGSAHNGFNGPCPPHEVNRRDLLGRSALHLIASSQEPASVDYLHALLAHPSLNVNLQDAENGWTALHRALYSANLITALILLRRTDTDTRIKDLEGLTPFDLYNSTVAGTNPLHEALSWDSSTNIKGRTLCQLYSWGSNRNFTLGLGDGDDRQLPDRVNLRREADEWERSQQALAAGKRFDRIGVRDVVMGRMHTVILTDERASNVWICGIGGNGRLGKAPQTQPRLEPLHDFRETARSVAVAQDHTIIVTMSGAAYTFGLNRFQQLGYTVEQGQGYVASSSGSGAFRGAAFGAAGSTAPTAAAAGELDVQISPRKVAGVLKKETVLGAAASKLHSVVFTTDGLYTWGTNTGQLGYDRGGTPVQVLPRRVTGLAAGTGIKQVAATEFGTACLLDSWDVVLFHNDTHYRINFPLSRFSSDISVFRPRQVQPKSWITKLTSSGNTFAALSDMGDLFTFNLEHPSEYGGAGGGRGGGGGGAASGHQGKMAAAQSAPRPQLVWSVRKKFTAVRDVAIGSDGSIILCTESGHVYVRSRKGDGTTKAAGKSFKFQAVPYLQRVVKVAINETGGLAAIKVDPPLPEVRMKGRTIEEALRDLLPHLKVRSITEDGEKEQGISAEMVEIHEARSDAGSSDDDSDSDADSDHGRGHGRATKRTAHDRHVHAALLLAEAAKRWTAAGSSGSRAAAADGDAAQPSSQPGRGYYGPHNLKPPFGCDAFLIAGNWYLPVHRVVLAARIPALRQALANPAAKVRLPDGVQVKKLSDAVASIVLPACSFGTALFFLHCVYSDSLPPVWTPSIGILVDKALKAAKIDRMQVQKQLLQLAELLGLSVLESAIRSPILHALTGTLRDDMLGFFAAHVDVADVEASPFRDVEIELEDRVVPAHSAILRRSPFFSALFQPQWTATRWNSRNIIRIDMRHLRWEVARIVLMHLYTDIGEALFRGTDTDRTMEQFMDFVVEVMAASNELLLDKLKLVCGSLLRNRVLSQNVGAVMTEAGFYEAAQLKEITMDYCTKNLESLLESGMLVELEHKMLRELTAFLRRRQDEKMRRTLAQDSVLALVEKHREYYDDLDIPPPSLHLITNKVQPKKGPTQVQLLSPRLAPADRRRSPANGRGSSPPTSSPDLRPVGEASGKNAPGGSDPAMMFSMDDEEGEPRSARSGSAGSPWATLPNVAQLSLDEVAPAPAAPSAAAQPWRARTVEAEKRAQSTESSPSLRATRPPEGASDLRSIMMSQEQQQQQQTLRRSTAASPSTSGTSTPNPSARPTVTAGGFDITPLSLASAKMSQKDRKRLQQQQQQQQQQQTASAAAAGSQVASASSSALNRPTTPAASPWKLPSASQTSPATAAFSPDGATPSSWGARASQLSDAMSTPQRRPSAAPLQSPGLGRGVVPSSEGGSARSSAGPPSTPLGPTFTPTRMQSSSAPRRTSNTEAAWSSPAIAPSSSSFLSSPPPSSPSVRADVSATDLQQARRSSSTASRPQRASNLQKSLDAGSTTGPEGATSSVTSVLSPSGSGRGSGSAGSLTFAQIQEQQRLAERQQTEQMAALSKRSFIDIIAEEKEEEERRRVELKQQEEFEKWFEEESRRIRREGGGGGAGRAGGKKGKGGGGGGGGGNVKGGPKGSGGNSGTAGGDGDRKAQNGASGKRKAQQAKQSSAVGGETATPSSDGPPSAGGGGKPKAPPGGGGGGGGKKKQATPSTTEGGSGSLKTGGGRAGGPGRGNGTASGGGGVPNGSGSGSGKANTSANTPASAAATAPASSSATPPGTALNAAPSSGTGLSIRAPAFVPSRPSQS
ncbi:uncharacterized protein PFL1_01867 [Pseudozyma flocculosa PF-1]|uniref:BTB domain-containing protein n=1 Tax=Pseudozyma flocculosa TaxID=84751 RepID=A0A5C3EZX0_9BASI|nr:uncharacterized protein PFL1_01867 [Pseudozyma flocculosa PF-1]EPQ30341.1 hypothetical protein PFL1_01867 [Pseudozyma flocculosa PF-1]SPO37410.1 uncharacterized protein PSFLO_02883 [Pseudozyma flocculosa]